MCRFAYVCGLLFLAGIARGAEHWAYIPPQVTTVENTGEGHPIDSLLAKSWQKVGLKSASLAPPRQWLERAAYTLTGLPPSAEQIQRISANGDEATWKILIEELLASPAYGERWARHWMDVARYADTRGYNFDQDNRYPFAYTYRDWLIRAFNEDMPFAKFVKLQIAADLTTSKPDDPDLAALGFLTVGPRGERLETIDDRVDVVTRGFLSSTVACARCHDHKFDPISTKDYYSLYSIFENTEEPEQNPVIGAVQNAADFDLFNQEVSRLEAADLEVRQAIFNQLRTPESAGIYLELAWQAHKENWDVAKATGDSFKRGRYRPAAVVRWRDFLKDRAWGENALPRLATWAAEMDKADADGRRSLGLALATEWLASTEGSDLQKLAAEVFCPLALDVARIPEIYDQEDGNQKNQRSGAMTKLMNDHAGSPPRAMSLIDRTNWSPAQVFVRGNPENPGETFEREWLGFLGGGKFEEGKSPRLSLAEKIGALENPLTARVLVNRVWAWHFGNGLTDPGDFGVQQADPPLRPLLDFLAVRFAESGGSIKELHRLILTSNAFRLAANGPEANRQIDEANAYFWKWNRRREDFEIVRDRLLASAGSLDTSVIGGKSRPLESIDADKRRSVYAFVDRYSLSNTFVSFDLPHPDHHSAKRIETTVPQQALYFLNGPLALRQSAKLAASTDFKNLSDPAAKLKWIYHRIYQRKPTNVETAEALEWLAAANPADYQARVSGTWEIRYAIDDAGRPGPLMKFPLIADKIWRTGPDLATAPVPWLSAGAESGHVGAGHCLILRWCALGKGQVRMAGNFRRTQKGGAPIAWNISMSRDSSIDPHVLEPEGSAVIETDWKSVEAGDTMDLVLRAPNGDHCGNVAWNLQVIGRESESSKPVELGFLKDKFPTSDVDSTPVQAGDPWADLIQMLWASNEFNFID